MPLGRIERRQQIVELAGARIEIDFGGQSFDQAIDLVDMLRHEPRREGFEMLDLRGRGRGGECVRHQVADLAAIKVSILAAPQRIEADIELALEPIDHQRIETDETILTDELIKPVLSLDQEVQAPLAVLHVEGQQVFYPRRKMVRGLGLEFERLAVGPRVDDAFA